MSHWKTKALLIHRYVTVLLANPALGGLLVCSVVVTTGAVLFWPKAVQRVLVSAKPAASATANPVVHAATIPVAARVPAAKMLPVATTHITAPKVEPVPQAPVFESATMNILLQPVTRFAGLPTRELMRHVSVRELMDSVVPHALFHYGTDLRLPTLMVTLFNRSTAPVEVREERYLMLSHTNAPPDGRGSEFFWADTRDGIGIGGIFYYPTNGEPTPTLTLFSQQVKREQIGIQQLPAEFLRELRAWQTQEHVPLVTVRYFINAQGEKTVLTHTEDLCTIAAADVCKKMNSDAAAIDANANDFLGQVHYASNATGRMVANSE